MLARNCYRARFAVDAADLKAAQRLRHRAFYSKRGAVCGSHGHDADTYDDMCRHVLIEEKATGRLVATLRLLPLASGAGIARSYSAQYYDLEVLAGYNKPMVEVGRFCVAPGTFDPNILRSAWAAITRYVDQEGVELLFGCSSFHGTNTQAYADAFAMLKERHLAPTRWLPRIKAPNVFRFAQMLWRNPDRTRALKTMPPLLRGYLNMGGWVSDHAVVDRELDTLHVFTGLEVRAIPPARARVLRAVAG